MSQDDWGVKVSAPEEIHEQLDNFVHFLCEIEQNNLIGVYLHGSLAMNCFHPRHSDLDLLILIQQTPPAARIRAWAQQILQSSCAPAPLELSILTHAQYTPWRHPTPFLFHFSESWRPDLLAALNAGSWHNWPQEHEADPDLAAHFTVTRRRGVRLAGAPITATVPDVPWHDYLDSLRRDFSWAHARAQTNPVYLVLNACRIWAAVSDRLVLSKAEGAAWAMPHLPLEVQTIVAAAAADYGADYGAGQEGDAPVSGAQARTVAQWIAPRLA